MEAMKFLVEKHLKDKFLEASRRSIKAGNSNDVYTFEMIAALKEMARKDVYPDGRFSDQDCSVWTMFRTAVWSS